MPISTRDVNGNNITAVVTTIGGLTLDRLDNPP
jgi:hypothetical protein